MCTHSCPTLCDPWTVARQAHLSMGFSRQEYWSRLPFPPPGDLPHPGIKLKALVSPALAGGFLTPRATWEADKRQQLGAKMDRGLGQKVDKKVRKCSSPWVLSEVLIRPQ